MSDMTILVVLHANAMMLVVALQRVVFVIWIARQGISVVIHARMILRLWRHELKITWYRLRWMLR